MMLKVNSVTSSAGSKLNSHSPTLSTPMSPKLSMVSWTLLGLPVASLKVALIQGEGPAGAVAPLNSTVVSKVSVAPGASAGTAPIRHRADSAGSRLRRLNTRLVWARPG